MSRKPSAGFGIGSAAAKVSQAPEVVTKQLAKVLKENNFDIVQATATLNDLANRIMCTVGLKKTNPITLERTQKVQYRVINKSWFDISRINILLYLWYY